MVRTNGAEASATLPADVVRRIVKPVLEALAERVGWVPVAFVPGAVPEAFGVGCAESDMLVALKAVAQGQGLCEPALIAPDRWVRTFPVRDEAGGEVFGHVVVVGRMSGSSIPAVTRMLSLLADLLARERDALAEREQLRQVEADGAGLRSRLAALEADRRFHDALCQEVASGGWAPECGTPDSLHQILRCLSRQFDAPVVLQGRNLLVLAQSAPDAAGCALIPGRHQSARDIVGPLGRAEGVVELPPTSACGRRLVAPVRGAGELLGFLTMAVNGQDAGPAAAALECASAFIALERLVHGELEEAQQFDRESLLRDLFTGNCLHRLLHRGLRMDIDLRRPFHPCAFVVTSPAGSPAQLRSLAFEAIREAIPAVTDVFGAILDDALVCLIPGDCVEDPRSVCERVVARAREHAMGVRCGVGPACEDLADYEPAVRKARWVIEVLEAINGQDCATFDDLGIYAILFDRDHSTQLDDFVERRLGALLSYDRLHKTDLVETLRCVLDTGGVMTEAAKQLFIHISTLKYRVNRIEELLGVELRDPQTAFNLHLACKILGVRRHLGKAEEAPDQQEDPPAELAVARRRAAMLAPVADEGPVAEEPARRPAGGARR